MEISFKWESDKPNKAEAIEGGLQFALDHFNDPRGIREQVVTAHLSLDAIKINVSGVGWSKSDAERLVIFKYSINEKTSSCVYYDSPNPTPS